MTYETNEIHTFSGKHKTPLWKLRLRYIYRILTRKQIILITVKDENIRWEYNSLSSHSIGKLLVALGEDYNATQAGVDAAQDIANDIKK